MAVRERLDDLVTTLEVRTRRPTDDAAAGARKVHFTLALTALAGFAAVWGLIYLAFGAWVAALICFAYAAVSLANLVVLARTRWFGRYQVVQLAAILTAPFLLQLSLGGFVAGSGAIVWSLMCPLAAVLFGPLRDAARWLAAYLVLVVVALVAQPTLGAEGELPQWAVESLFVMNLGAVSVIVFGMVASFGRARDALQSLERAYVEQTLVLQQREKLATLGTLAAGVAHELNNPAAAVRRAGEQLSAALAQMAERTTTICGAALLPVGASRSRLLAVLGRRPDGAADRLTPLDRAAREEEVEAWLDDHGVPQAWELAPTLVAMGTSTAELDPLADDVEPDRLPALLSLLVEYAAARGLADDVADGSARISEIVAALKSYAYLDRGTVQVVDVHEGLDSTLVLLRSQLSRMTVERRYAEHLPQIEARGNELNQVWTNLIDNAAAATGGEGTLVVRTFAEGTRIVVELEDDGPGIPKGVIDRVFDPFFTTKAPGSGTGLGLSISHSIVTEHGGSLTVTSRPGCTTFRVELPTVGGTVRP